MLGPKSSPMEPHSSLAPGTLFLNGREYSIGVRVTVDSGFHNAQAVLETLVHSAFRLRGAFRP